MAAAFSCSTKGNEGLRTCMGEPSASRTEHDLSSSEGLCTAHLSPLAAPACTENARKAHVLVTHSNTTSVDVAGTSGMRLILRVFVAGEGGAATSTGMKCRAPAKQVALRTHTRCNTHTQDNRSVFWNLTQSALCVLHYARLTSASASRACPRVTHQHRSHLQR
jgi:hypothetical protein